MKLWGVAALLLSVQVQANSWSQVTQPAIIADTPQSIGTYTSGCLSGAAILPKEGLGYQVMRLSRNRFYGHPELTQFIEKLGQATAAQGLGALLVGDLGQVRGGPTLSGHRSHQTGLDVDIWFMLSQQAMQRSLTLSERESWSAPSVLAADGDSIDLRQWTGANAKVLELAATMPEVDRIFVNASVKRELCLRRVGNSPWLRKIRPWWKHDDHFHVRLKCPAGNAHCAAQEPLPAGDGCDASLAWWFSDEAKNPAKGGKPSPPPPPLPALCSRVLAQ
ncbi:penicillin-insensitive murein endopeptidase [Methylovulum psychrotolerans]|jgi:penicillin-insensitive murein endopeptidase|uniref:Penicillin-insensitive murein endopeptidase n=1 Tax=Methylovulum psychrotolerans TaxID=1704499 RepID=A0A1Z4C1E4_9GAMM|nr:penicillin-insensitive murein endopeptidase [Methylovulum psychrotolerans]ASF47362.1 penicillin-insensitive murein endopeptidase [Methylovulum psychrotolerans]MBT9096813.1 penicillin-insensitive murein endopeptidase [Methylovulum psychrotolerans]POZ51032.1 penicillin-insensitive murein endopeptidase [Methylovulum psychrotolerans]